MNRADPLKAAIEAAAALAQEINGLDDDVLHERLMRQVRNLAAALTAAQSAAAKDERLALQEQGKHPAPCAGHCEAAAFNAEIRRLSSALSASQTVAYDRNQIREIFLAHGFTIKEGCADLKPYVYKAARAVEADLNKRSAAPVSAGLSDDQGLLNLIEDLDELASEMAYEANQTGSQETADRAYLVERGARALLALSQQKVAEGFVVLPMIPNRAMRDVMEGEDWQWEDLLAAAAAITEEQYEAIAAAPMPKQQEG